jgi:hypothetical protein
MSDRRYSIVDMDLSPLPTVILWRARGDSNLARCECQVGPNGFGLEGPNSTTLPMIEQQSAAASASRDWLGECLAVG